MRIRPLVCLFALLVVDVAGPARAEVLWRGDFETADLSQWNGTLNATTGQRSNISVVSDPVFSGGSAAALTIHPDDLWPNNHNRVELHYDAMRTGEGQTTFFSWYFQLPEDVRVHEDIAYWESDQSYQQTMAFFVDPIDDGMQLSFRTNRPSAITHWRTTLSPTVWHQLAMQILWSTDPSVGKLSVWLNGQLVVDDVSAQTKPDTNPVFVQIGFHRNQSEMYVETIYVDEAVEGTTLEDVLAPQPTGGTGGTSGSGGATATGGSAGIPGSGGTTPGDGGSAGRGGSGTSAGSGGTTAGGGPSAGGSAGSAGNTPAGDDSGCSCRSAGRAPRSPGLLMLGIAAAALLARRRRREAQLDVSFGAQAPNDGKRPAQSTRAPMRKET